MKRFAKIVLILLVFLSALALLAYGILQTQFAQSRLEKYISETVSTPEQHISINGLHGSFPFALRIGRIALSDGRGEWLNVEDAAVDWKLDVSPLTYDVDLLSAERVHLLRLPEGEKKPPKEISFQLPHLPRIALRDIRLPRIEVEQEVSGKRLVLSATGNVRTFYDAANPASYLNVDTLEGPATHISMKAEGEKESLRLNLNMGEEQNGLIGALLGLPDSTLDATLLGEGLLPAFQAKGNMRAADKDMLTLSLTSKENAQHGLDINAAANINWPDAPAYISLQKYTGASAEVIANATLNNDGSVKIEQFRLSSERLNASAHGEYGQDSLSFDYQLQLPDLAPFGAERGHMELNGNAKGSLAALDITGSGNGTVNDLKDVVLHYSVKKQAALLHIEQLQMLAENAEVSTEGNVDLDTQALDLSVQTHADDLTKLLPEMGGAVSLQATIHGAFSDIGFSAHGSGNQLKGLPDIIGSHIEFSGNGNVSESRYLTVKSANVKSAYISADAEGKMDLSTRILEGKLEGALSDLARLNENLRGQGRVNAELVGRPEAPQGKVEIAASNAGKRLVITSAFSMDEKYIRLPDIKGGVDSLKLEGDFVMNRATSRLDSTLALNAKDLSALNAFLAQPIGGSAEITVALKDKDRKQQFGSKAALRNFIYAENRVEEATVDLSIADLEKRSGINAMLNAKNIQAGDRAIDALNATAKGDTGNTVFSVSALSRGADAFEVRTKGAFANANADWTLSLNELNGRYDARPFSLQALMVLAGRKEGITLSPTVLAFDKGEISAQGNYSPARVSAAMNLKDLPVSLFTQDAYRGRINGDVTLGGTPKAPTVKATLTASLLAALQKTKKLLISVDVLLESGKLNATAKQVQDEGEMRVSMSLPVEFSLEPYRFSIPPAGSLKGQVVMDSNVDALAGFFLPSGQRLSGYAKGSLAISGTMHAPRADGEIHFADGTYENTATGTLLEKMQATLRALPDKLELSGFTATDSEKGTISGGGFFGLTAPNPLALSFSAHEAVVLRSTQATGAVNGDVKMSGTLSAPLIGGSLILGPMEINLPEGADNKISEVPLTNPEVLPGYKADMKPEVSAFSQAAKLDIKIGIPARVFVRGRGLETEMRGNLHITGSPAEPAIDGNLRTVRGTFTLLDRDLTISEGTLTFEGPMPPSPFIHMVAETTTKDITAGVQLNGSVRAPSLALTSTPSLPQDEILAHILFGRDMRSMTPFQAIQLAQALQTLKGGNGSSSLDLLGKARNILGVDRLSVGQSDSGDVAVGAGKYINDKLYVGVEGGAGEDAGKLNAEIELTPRLSLETETGARSSGVRANWKYDY